MTNSKAKLLKFLKSELSPMLYRAVEIQLSIEYSAGLMKGMHISSEPATSLINNFDYSQIDIDMQREISGGEVL